MILAGGAVAWHSRKQEVIAQSTTEAELIAASAAAKEILWITKLLADFKVKTTTPIILYEDNQSAIALSHLRPGRDKLKHLATKYQYVRGLVNEGVIKLKYTPTENMLADIFTKALSRKKMMELRENIGCVLDRTSGGVRGGSKPATQAKNSWGPQPQFTHYETEQSYGETQA